MPIEYPISVSRARFGRRWPWTGLQRHAASSVLLSVGMVLAQRTLPDVTLVANTTINGESANLVPVDAIAIGPNGMIALTQRQDFAVRFYGPNGAPVGSAGRRGSGPGEFLSLSTVGWSHDSLWTWDSRLRRLTVFSTAGKVLRDVTVVGFVRTGSSEPESIPGRVLAVFPDGSLLVDGLARRNAAGGVGSPQDRVAFVASDSGRVQRIVMTVPPDPGSLVVHTARGMSEVSVPYATRPLLVSSPDGRRIGVVWLDPAEANARFHARVIEVGGRVIYDREFAFERVPIGKKARDSSIATRLRRLTDDEVRRKVSAGLLERIPSYFPPFAAAVLGADGRLWIELRADSRERRWLVLSASGATEFRARIPANVSVRSAVADGVWGVRDSDSGDLSIVHFRIPPYGVSTLPHPRERDSERARLTRDLSAGAASGGATASQSIWLVR